MPLRATTIEKRISSEGIDPDGNNPFARNSFVEKVEMDVLRKPMKADEIRPSDKLYKLVSVEELKRFKGLDIENKRG